MVAPNHQGVPDRAFQSGAVVGSCNAVTKPGNMVERGLDNMWRNTQFAGARSKTSADVVQDPVPHPESRGFDALIERCFGRTPTGERATWIPTEDKIRVRATSAAIEDRADSRSD